MHRPGWLGATRTEHNRRFVMDQHTEAPQETLARAFAEPFIMVGESEFGPPNLLTDSLTLASYLLAKGHRFPGLLPSRGGVLFTFLAADVTHDVELFKHGEALIEPRVFDAARIGLRRKMDQAMRNGR